MREIHVIYGISYLSIPQSQCFLNLNKVQKTSEDIKDPKNVLLKGSWEPWLEKHWLKKLGKLQDSITDKIRF